LTNRHAAGGISDAGYVAIGSGVACLVLIGAGRTRVLSRRRRRQPVVAQPRVTG
jgi:hypothetical protein